MPTYTVLGGTGSTGSAVLRALHTSPPRNLTLRILIRSKSRLLDLLPFLSSSTDTPQPYHATIIEGSFSDPQTLSKCLIDTDVIFSCIASNDSSPGLSIALDIATAIISTLESIRSSSTIPKNSSYTKPTILMLSSASMSPTFPAYSGPPAPVKYLLETALYYEYTDLRRAESLYRSTMSSAPDLFSVLFIQPPAIMPGLEPTGYEISTSKLSTVVSYADLGAGMVEIGNKSVGGEGEGWRSGTGITVVATGSVRSDWGPNTKALAKGLLAYLMPGVWRWGREGGWW